MFKRSCPKSRPDPIVPLGQYDSVWFYVDDGKHGGQLLRSQALINRQSNDGATELVYDLEAVDVTHLPYNDNAKPDRTIDIFNEKIRKKHKIFVGAFVSSLQTGKIFNLKIYYRGGEINLLPAK